MGSLRTGRGAPRWLAAALLAAAATYGGEAAAADPPPAETLVVSTKDGAVFRGTLVEKVPGKHIVLQLVTGEIRRIPWTDLASERPAPAATSASGAAETAPAPAAAPPVSVAPAPAAPPAETASAEGGRVRVTFQADEEDARLERLEARDTWVTACTAGCTTTLETDAVYRVGGAGIRKSRPFRLPADRGAITVQAEAGTSANTGWGVVLMIGGGVAVPTGLMLLLAGALVDETDPRDDDHSGLTTSGAVLTVGGLAAGIGGLLMLVNNKTEVNLARRSLRYPVMTLPGGLRLENGRIAF